MAIKISQLTTLPSATTNTRFPVIESGVNYGASFGNIVSFVSTNLTSMSGNLSVNILTSTNNGNGTNFKVGDDAWIGDVNISNTLAVRGVQDAEQGYIIFGNANNTTYIGRSGTGPITATGNFAVTGNISTTNITCTLATAAQPNVTSVGTLTSLAVTGSLTAGNISASGTTTVKGINEAFVLKTGATGVIAHDYSAGTIFSHSSLAADFTVNITNLTLPTLNTTNITLVLTQGATAYIPSALQIAGAAQSIKWQGGSAPTGNANKTDIVSFSIMNNAGTYTVLGQLVTFG
jgi:hypothetical protein